MTRTVLLALDTSTEFCSVALLIADPAAESNAPNASEASNALTGSKASEQATSARHAPRVPPRVPPHFTSASAQVWFRHEATGPVASTRLLPAVRELFDEAGLALADCTAIAFGAGPGSFTGLRTATGVAQGLAFGLGVPVVPVGTLLACAEFARIADPSVARVLAVLDARMDEVYSADFAFDAATGDWRTVRAAALDAPDALALPDAPFTLAGNAAAAFGERLPAVAAAASVDRAALPHALPVATAGLRAWRAGRAIPADQAMPEYIRNKVAQTTAERMEARAAKEAGGAGARPANTEPAR